MRVVNVGRTYCGLIVLLVLMSSCMQNAAVAQPKSSALDPYSYIQAPTKQEREAQLEKKNKKKRKGDDVASSASGTNLSAVNQSNGVVGPIDVVMDSVKQSTAGLGKSIASGTAGMFNGTKKLGSKLIPGVGKHKDEAPKEKVASAPKQQELPKVEKTAVKPAEKNESVKAPKVAKQKGEGAMGKLSSVNKAVAGGFMSAGGAVKSGTVTVARGFKTAGGKIVDGTQAAGGKLASLPKAIHIGGKKPKSMTASKPSDSAAPSHTETTASSSTAPATTASSTSGETAAPADSSVSALRPEKELSTTASTGSSKSEHPKKDNGGGFSGAAKRLAAAPKTGLSVIGHGFGKLNPFHKEQKSPAATAAKPTGSVTQ